MTENTAKFAGGSFVQAKYSDLIDPKLQDNRTCEEITAEVVKRRGLVVKHESICTFCKNRCGYDRSE